MNKIEKILLDFYEYYNQGNCDKLAQATAEIYEAVKGCFPLKKDCAHNKKWQSTYPKDCENIGFNLALTNTKANLKNLFEEE